MFVVKLLSLYQIRPAENTAGHHISPNKKMKKEKHISYNVCVYAMFCVVKRSKIWESEVQRENRIYCVRRAERSDSGVRVQRALRIF